MHRYMVEEEEGWEKCFNSKINLGLMLRLLDDFLKGMKKTLKPWKILDALRVMRGIRGIRVKRVIGALMTLTALKALGALETSKISDISNDLMISQTFLLYTIVIVCAIKINSKKNSMLIAS
ncbi:hypothetical protein J3Q64DRAFT_1697876 [Phycomyces blakesleeanus]|uniref:Uncharacterized protein n=2 Tax=Phycomyces blakesleeanus TaxID=4837 RepID=A0A167LMP5_PHYB8|nr:hypothetical protein PHYBLDRAFT_170848 [Phycomyces blakesleeanus NRRL 1555(-)]OAD70757.1 hypothetical protein PHYBLDRAFT_170848 [Phycomyces blakesleeanus NRRL 1555(-)]|eukprot:XP_018288797.1 hypothetical protein PHYBLDRAFT_170848 [Phycomyces blakesleeanus NRRL 1555(-)]